MSQIIANNSGDLCISKTELADYAKERREFSGNEDRLRSSEGRLRSAEDISRSSKVHDFLVNNKETVAGVVKFAKNVGESKDGRLVLEKLKEAGAIDKIWDQGEFVTEKFKSYGFVPILSVIHDSISARISKRDFDKLSSSQAANAPGDIARPSLRERFSGIGKNALNAATLGFPASRENHKRDIILTVGKRALRAQLEAQRNSSRSYYR